MHACLTRNENTCPSLMEVEARVQILFSSFLSLGLFQHISVATTVVADKRGSGSQSRDRRTGKEYQ